MLWKSGSRQSYRTRTNWCNSQVINIQHWGIFSHHFATQGLWHPSVQMHLSCRITFPSFRDPNSSLQLLMHSMHFAFSTPLSAPSGTFLFFSVQPSAAGATKTMESENSQNLTPLRPLHPAEGRIRTKIVHAGSWAMTLFPLFVLHIGQRWCL